MLQNTLLMAAVSSTPHTSTTLHTRELICGVQFLKTKQNKTEKKKNPDLKEKLFFPQLHKAFSSVAGVFVSAENDPLFTTHVSRNNMSSIC